MRTIEEIEAKISLLIKHREDKTLGIKKNYDDCIQILRWALGEDRKIQSLGWRERIDKINNILEDWPHDKHTAFNTLYKIRDVAHPTKNFLKLEDIEHGH